jgi:hypothetical protein
MKNNIFTLFFILTSGFVFAQVNTENGQTGKIKYSDKSTLKSGDTKKPEVSKPVVVEETEPVIILRLEYKSEESVQPKNETQVETKVEQVETTPARTIEDEIAEVDKTIEAIDIKVNVIKNDKVENKKAIESGWYEQMAEYRKTAVAKKEVLINSKK